MRRRGGRLSMGLLSQLVCSRLRTGCAQSGRRVHSSIDKIEKYALRLQSHAYAIVLDLDLLYSRDELQVGLGPVSSRLPATCGLHHVVLKNLGDG